MAIGLVENANRNTVRAYMSPNEIKVKHFMCSRNPQQNIFDLLLLKGETKFTKRRRFVCFAACPQVVSSTVFKMCFLKDENHFFFCFLIRYGDSSWI